MERVSSVVCSLSLSLCACTEYKLDGNYAENIHQSADLIFGSFEKFKRRLHFFFPAVTELPCPLNPLESEKK